jgi:hypothetical protein
MWHANGHAKYVAYNTLVEKLSWRKPIRRPRRKWNNNIKKGLEGMSGSGLD